MFSNTELSFLEHPLMSCLKPIHAASTFFFSTLLLATAALAHQHLPEEHNGLEREALLEGFGWNVETAEIRTEKNRRRPICAVRFGGQYRRVGGNRRRPDRRRSTARIG